MMQIIHSMSRIIAVGLFRGQVRCLSLSCARFQSSHSWRTHACGELRKEQVGCEVTLCGWVEFRRPKKFLVLRDWSGNVQLLLKKGNCKHISIESVVKAVGVIQPRPMKDINSDMATGEVEVHVDELDVLNPSEPLPFRIHEFSHKGEGVRLQYRYLDIRTQTMQNNLRIRSKLISSMREFLIHNHGFVEVETPTLFRPTPGGAREFIVPTSTEKGMFYSLPQSPQQFKQLLMVGGIDRYFQVAKCYRDEGAKPDRQPEFTQLDIEMSFVNANDIMNLTETMIKSCWPCDLGDEAFPKITYKKAIESYGSDKPDIRFPLLLQNVTDCLKTTGYIKDSKHASCLIIPREFASFLTEDSLKDVHESVDFEKSCIRNFIFQKNQGGVAAFLGSDIDPKVMEILVSKFKLEENEFILLSCGGYYDVKTYLGKCRLAVANAIENQGIGVREDSHKFLWVYDFPLFEYNSDNDLQCVHHPFTAPHPADLEFLESDPIKVRSLAYDLVLNGKEIAGGSIRIHDPVFQRRILKDLKIETSKLEHLLCALKYGAPPHGGIALGLDRVLAEICNADSIRDVIAFPKSSVGKDLMCDAPCEVDNDTLEHFFPANPVKEE